jgi:hypothetical protein
MFFSMSSRRLGLAACWLPFLAACSFEPARKASTEIESKTAISPGAAVSPNRNLSPETIISRSPGRVEVLSPVYKIDRIFRSMTGPWTQMPVRLLESAQPELLWITGCRVEMVDEQASRPMPEQFMCHVNLDFDMDEHKRLFGMKEYRDPRLFTLSQGQLEIRLPEGFGVPIRSDEVLEMTTQVLNLNWPDQTFKVRHRVLIDYVPDAELTRPYQPLVQCGVFGMVSLEGREIAYDANELLYGKCPSCCVPGQKALDWAEGIDRYARRFSNHWVVAPGRWEYRTRATSTLNVTADTAIHYIAVHVHPFAESLELRDLTSGESIFTSRARNMTDIIGLEHVDYLSSAEGVPVTKGHEYELLTTYNNTSATDQDSMAVMYSFLLDKEYHGADLTVEAKPASTAAKSWKDAVAKDTPAASEEGLPAAPSRPTVMKMPPVTQKSP